MGSRPASQHRADASGIDRLHPRGPAFCADPLFFAAACPLHSHCAGRDRVSRWRRIAAERMARRSSLRTAHLIPGMMASRRPGCIDANWRASPDSQRAACKKPPGCTVSASAMRVPPSKRRYRRFEGGLRAAPAGRLRHACPARGVNWRSWLDVLVDRLSTRAAVWSTAESCGVTG